MDDVLIAVLLGLAGGIASGMLGIGGGAIFVPGLVIFLDVAQVRAEATSLLAIVPVAIVGAYRQRGYGNLNERAALILGLLALPGVLLGVALANVVSERLLAVAFACVQVVFAIGLARRALTGGDDRSRGGISGA
jgi:uncharacterized membrane protein YfcA